MRSRKIIAGVMVAALGLGTELMAETPSVSFGFGPGGVTFNVSTYYKHCCKHHHHHDDEID